MFVYKVNAAYLEKMKQTHTLKNTNDDFCKMQILLKLNEVVYILTTYL
jgi:hypothetical protein